MRTANTKVAYAIESARKKKVSIANIPEFSVKIANIIKYLDNESYNKAIKHDKELYIKYGNILPFKLQHRPDDSNHSLLKFYKETLLKLEALKARHKETGLFDMEAGDNIDTLYKLDRKSGTESVGLVSQYSRSERFKIGLNYTIGEVLDDAIRRNSLIINRQAEIDRMTMEEFVEEFENGTHDELRKFREMLEIVGDLKFLSSEFVRKCNEYIVRNKEVAKWFTYWILNVIEPAYCNLDDNIFRELKPNDTKYITEQSIKDYLDYLSIASI